MSLPSAPPPNNWVNHSLRHPRQKLLAHSWCNSITDSYSILTSYTLSPEIISSNLVMDTDYDLVDGIGLMSGDERVEERAVVVVVKESKIIESDIQNLLKLLRNFI